MAFEKWRGTTRTSGPLLSVRQGGFLGLNKSAIEEYELRRFGYVALHFDPATGRIGLKFSKTNEESAKRLIVRQAGTSLSCTIAGKAFLDYWGVDRTKPFSAPLTKEKGLFVADVSEIRIKPDA